MTHYTKLTNGVVPVYNEFGQYFCPNKYQYGSPVGEFETDSVRSTLDRVRYQLLHENTIKNDFNVTGRFYRFDKHVLKYVELGREGLKHFIKYEPYHDKITDRSKKDDYEYIYSFGIQVFGKLDVENLLNFYNVSNEMFSVRIKKYDKIEVLRLKILDRQYSKNLQHDRYMPISYNCLEDHVVEEKVVFNEDELIHDYKKGLIIMYKHYCRL